MYICIEGNIGAGKSTLAKAFAQQRKAVFLPEHFEDNPLLPLFYKHGKKLAFPLEYSFLIGRHAQLSHFFEKHKKRDVIADFSLYKCLWFAKANLDKKDFSFYKKHFDIIRKYLPEPDLIVFLDTETSNLRSNIRKRGRHYEKEIDEKYLKRVSKNYRKGLKELKKIDVLKIRIGHYGPETTAFVLSKIDQHLGLKAGVNRQRAK